LHLVSSNCRGIYPHRPEFRHLKNSVAHTHSIGPVKHRTRRGKFDQQGHQEHRKAEQKERRQYRRTIKDTFHNTPFYNLKLKTISTFFPKFPSDRACAQAHGFLFSKE